VGYPDPALGGERGFAHVRPQELSGIVGRSSQQRYPAVGASLASAVRRRIEPSINQAGGAGESKAGMSVVSSPRIPLEIARRSRPSLSRMTLSRMSLDISHVIIRGCYRYQCWPVGTGRYVPILPSRLFPNGSQAFRPETRDSSRCLQVAGERRCQKAVREVARPLLRPTDAAARKADAIPTFPGGCPGPSQVRRRDFFLEKPPYPNPIEISWSCDQGRQGLGRSAQAIRARRVRPRSRTTRRKRCTLDL
jgi:hypothetical protein